jgi:hypothetical protein
MIQGPDQQDKDGLETPRDFGLEAALADREAEEVARDLGLEEPVAAFGPADASERVSPEAYKLIVQHETGGRTYYEKVYKGRPVWPKGASGITIGFGYDLGYVNGQQFERDWHQLPAAIRERLAETLGKHGGSTSTAVLSAHADALKDVTISWELAEVVFRGATLPKFATLTYRALPRCDDLAPHSFGALVSLTFNRGASYGIPSAKDPSGRYVEMREIKASMAQGNFGAIPQCLRAMKRIWTGAEIEKEMYRRRENEAALFERGLEES